MDDNIRMAEEISKLTEENTKQSKEIANCQKNSKCSGKNSVKGMLGKMSPSWGKKDDLKSHSRKVFVRFLTEIPVCASKSVRTGIFPSGLPFAASSAVCSSLV